MTNRQNYASVNDSFKRGVWNERMPNYKPNVKQNREKPQSGLHDYVISTITDDIYGENPAVHLISSKYRNHDTYPEPNSYRIKFNKTYKQVTRIELTSAIIPNTGFIINERNNTIYFRDTQAQIDTGDLYTITIPIGNWSIDNLLTNISDALTEVSLSTYTASFAQSTGRITISQDIGGTNIFELLFDGGKKNYGAQSYIEQPNIYLNNGKKTGTTRTKVGESETVFPENSIGPIIGFERIDYTGSTQYVGKFSYNLKNDNFIVLKLNTNMGRMDSIADHVDGGFCPIFTDSEIGNYSLAKNNKDINNDSYSMIFNPPLEEIAHLDISFYNSDGELYDFNGHDHVLTFEFSSLTRVGAYRR